VAIAPPAQDPVLADMPIGELETLAAWIQHLLRRRLLVAEPDVVGSELAALAGLGDVGATRVLRREWAEFDTSTALGIGGGGAYFSFASKSHHYGDRPDLGLQGGHYDASFYGNMAGALLPLGDLPLADLGTQLPRSMGMDATEAWELMWQPALDRAGRVDENWVRRAADLQLWSTCPALPGRTYLLHRAGGGEHDLLVAFRTVATDAYGHTIVYRVLRAFTAPDQRAVSMPKAPPGEPPAWLNGRDVEQLLELLAQLRAVAEPRLLAVSEAVLTAHRTWLARGGCGVDRILSRGRFNAIVASREGAAYFDFVAKTHAYDGGVHLGLEAGRFSTGFAGSDTGFVLDLGPVPLETAENAQPVHDEGTCKALVLVRDLQPVKQPDGALRVAPRDEERARDLGLAVSCPASAGHTYLLRAVKSDHTVLVAFQVIEFDAGGATLAWRILSREGR
jgi:hypothetical protein